jgi:hypothetical protein
LHPKTPKTGLYYYGERWPNVHHARLRMCCSLLNSHLHKNIHVIDSSSCACGNKNEDADHFLLNCPLFTAPREKLFKSLLDLGILKRGECLNSLVLLFGDQTLSPDINEKIFECVHSYLKETGRFNI